MKKMSKQLLAFFATVIIFSVPLAENNMDFFLNSFAQAPSSSANQTLSARLPGSPQLDFRPDLSASQKNASVDGTCTLVSTSTKLHRTPQQTEGPYFVDGMPNRSDIRSDTSNGLLQQGIPLSLVIRVYDVDNGSCLPIKGAKVDIWHANSGGVYSAVNDMGTNGKNFLRGYQVTDNNGTVRFTTIYPGWYPGRAIHIHDKIRTFNGSVNTLEWTAQLYSNNTMNEQIHEQTPYSSHGPPQTLNEEDMIYTGASTDGLVRTNSGNWLVMNVTKDGSTYLGTFNIVLDVQ